MHIWLITIGEPLPTDGSNNRLLRTGILANLLESQRHTVTWWSSTFDHIHKVHRFDTDTTIDVSKRYKLILLHSRGYKKNVSLERIYSHYGIARKFARMAPMHRRPDIIVCSLPILELCSASIQYGKKHDIPVVLDVRDLWPDIFIEMVPSWCRGFTKRLLFPFFNTVRSACKEASAITGVTSSFVTWGVEYAERSRTEFDRDFPMGYSQLIPGTEEIDSALRRWHELGVRKEDFNVCFFGTIGRQFELDTVIEAAGRLLNQNRPYRFIICGTGDKLTSYKKRARGYNNIIFPGWVNSADIFALMRISSVGLAPYRSIPNFTMNLPNKPLEYLSAGLPIVSSLKGMLQELLATNRCGITYENGNPEDLALNLIRLFDDRAILKAMSQNASLLYKDKFVAEKVYGDMIAHLELISRQ